MLPFLIPVIVTGLKVAAVATAAGVAYAAANDITSNIIKWARASIAKIKELMRSKNAMSSQIKEYKKSGNCSYLKVGLYDENDNFMGDENIEAEYVDSNIYEGCRISLSY